MLFFNTIIVIIFYNFFPYYSIYNLFIYSDYSIYIICIYLLILLSYQFSLQSRSFTSALWKCSETFEIQFSTFQKCSWYKISTFMSFFKKYLFLQNLLLFLIECTGLSFKLALFLFTWFLLSTFSVSFRFLFFYLFLLLFFFMLNFIHLLVFFGYHFIFKMEAQKLCVQAHDIYFVVSL